MRFIFTEYANGTDKKEIAEELNKRHILYKGKPFTFRTFENWLSNAKYTGEFMHGQRLCANTYPAIIDKATFAKVQKRLQQNKILAGANSAIEPYLLTGKAFCGHCGTAMIAGGGTSRLLKGDPNDKEYQKKLIDHLVYKVFVYDDTVVTYLIFGNDKEIKEISLADNDKAITGLTQRVQPLSLLVHRLTAKTNTIIYKVNRRELYCAVELPLSDYPLYGKQLVARG